MLFEIQIFVSLIWSHLVICPCELELDFVSGRLTLQSEPLVSPPWPFLGVLSVIYFPPTGLLIFKYSWLALPKVQFNLSSCPLSLWVWLFLTLACRISWKSSLAASVAFCPSSPSSVFVCNPRLLNTVDCPCVCVNICFPLAFVPWLPLSSDGTSSSVISLLALHIVSQESVHRTLLSINATLLE